MPELHRMIDFTPGFHSMGSDLMDKSWQPDGLIQADVPWHCVKGWEIFAVQQDVCAIGWRWYAKRKRVEEFLRILALLRFLYFFWHRCIPPIYHCLFVTGVWNGQAGYTAGMSYQLPNKHHWQNIYPDYKTINPGKVTYIQVSFTRFLTVLTMVEKNLSADF